MSKSNAITKQGRNLIAKGIAGAQINFTRIAIGSGRLPEGQTPYEQTALVQKVMDIEIVKTKLLGEGTVVLGGYFDNSDVTGDGFYYREVGAYAFDPDANKEILFSYGNAGEDAEKIEPVGVGGLVSKSIDLITAVDKAENIMVEINPSGLITVEMFEAQAAQAAADVANALRMQHPVGSITLHAGAHAPAGFLLCQGQAVSRATYANLFKVCGTTYGSGDGAATFHVPDMNGRVGVGAGGATPLGSVGGVAKQRLNYTNMPGEMMMFVHTTLANNEINPEHCSTGLWHSNGEGVGSMPLSNTRLRFAQEFENMPPYLALSYIIKT